MKIRPGAKHVYAFTQRERDCIVVSLRSTIEDEAGEARSSSWARLAEKILNRITDQEEMPPL